MKTTISIKQVGDDAKQIYQAGELECAQAVVWAIIKNLDPQMPEALMHAASGFSVGVGKTQCMCSTVSAAVLCLGYFFGRTFPTTPTDPSSLKTLTLAFELQEVVKKQNKVLCCHLIRKGASDQQRLEKCANTISLAAAKVAEIIALELNLKVVA